MVFGFRTLRHSLASFPVRTKTDAKTTLQLYAHSIGATLIAAQGEMLEAILQSSNLATAEAT